MSVNNVYNNKVNLVKAAMVNQAKKSTAAAKPEYMQMTGSIFNAPGVNSKTKTEGTITDLNTKKSISDLNNANNTQITASSNSSTTPENIENIDNASDGKAAAASAEASANNVRSLTADTEKDATTVDKFNRDSIKLNEEITQDNKKFEKNLKTQEKELKETNNKLQKVVKESEQAQKEIEDAQNELESLLGSNTFSINGQNGSANNDRIKELQTIIGTKTQIVQQNGQVIYTLQRSSTRTLKQMNQTNKAYVRTQNINQRSIEENRSEADKVIKVASTIEQVSALVSQVGQALNYAGQGLVALASASWISPPVSAALIATGNIMQKIGKVTDMVGQYGQAAANVTKTAAYAADGNLAGALQSAAAAIQTGVSAGKSTANLKNDFASIDKAAQDATQKAASNQAAKEAIDAKQQEAVQKLANEKGVDVSELSRKEVKQAKSDALGGLSEKQARKNISNDLQSKLANEEVKLDSNLSRKEQIAQFGSSNKDTINASLNDGIKKDYAMKAISQKTTKSSNNFWNEFQKWGSSLQNVAALYSAYDNQNNYAQSTSAVPDFYFDQRTLDIMEKNKKRRAALG